VVRLHRTYGAPEVVFVAKIHVASPRNKFLNNLHVASQRTLLLRKTYVASQRTKFATRIFRSFAKQMYYTYILQSLKNKSIYVGFTIDLKSRLEKHNKGEVISTKSRSPFKLIHYEAFANEKDAKAREEYLKSGWGTKSIKILLANYLSE